MRFLHLPCVSGSLFFLVVAGWHSGVIVCACKRDWVCYVLQLQGSLNNKFIIRNGRKIQRL